MSNKHASPRWRLLQDTRGTIAVMFGVVLPVLLMAGGIGVDLARLYLLKQELQQVADAATLGAGAIIGNKTDALLRATAEKYIAANPIPGEMVKVTIDDSKYHEDTRSYELRLRGELDTTLLRAVWIDTLTTTATSHALRALPGPVEMVIVADYTVSMGINLGWGVGDGSRLGALQSAASNLIDVLSDYDDVSIGIVPFSSNINVDADRWRQSQTVGNSVIWSDTPEAAEWLALAVSSRIRDWTGCIGVRKYDLRPKLGGFVAPAGQKYPRNINPPACTAVGTLKALPAMIPLKKITEHSSELKSAFGRRGGSDGSFVPAGLIGAWHLLDPAVPFSEAKTYSRMTELGGRKVIVLLTDGGNIIGPSFSLAQDIMLPGQANVEEANRIQNGLCNNIKAAGIEIYVISFLQGDPNQGAQEPLLVNCATAQGRHFFSINSANALSDAFQDITGQIVKVRLTN